MRGLLFIFLMLGLAGPVSAQATEPSPLPGPGRLAYQSFGAADADIPPAGVRIEVAIDITARGRADGCTIITSTGSNRLDEAVCRMVRRGRYNPAMENGVPVRAVLRQQMVLTGRHAPPVPPEATGTPPGSLLFPTYFASHAETPAAPQSVSAWITPADYPVDALQARQEGDVGVRFALSPTGKVERCEVVSSSGAPSLDEATCRLAIARATYPVEQGLAQTTIQRTLRWQLPRGGSWISSADYPPDARRDGREGTVGVAFDVNVEGRIENCRVTQSSGSLDLDEATCRAVTARGRYTPARDEQGRATRDSKALSFRWTLSPGQ